MSNCSCCFSDFIAKCEDEIRVFITLPPYNTYRWVITDGFQNKHQGDLQPHDDGGYFIDVNDLPDGLLTQHSGTMKLEVFEDGVSSCAPEQFLISGKYNCIEFTISGGNFEKNNLGCDNTCVDAPACADQPLIFALSQTGTDAPVMTVLSTPFDADIVWARSSSGEYQGTLAGAFPDGTVLDYTSNGAVTLLRASDNTITVSTLGDGVLSNTVFKVTLP